MLELPSPELRLAALGLYHQDPGCHPEYDDLPPGIERLELVTGGRGWVAIEGEWMEVTAGALLWHIGGDQTIARSDFGDPYRCLSVQVENAPDQRIAPRLSWWRDIEEIRRFVGEVVHARADDRFDSGVLLAYVRSRLLFQARQWQRVGDREELPPKLRRALELLESEPMSLREVAAEVGWSIAHLHDVFRTRLEVTPHEVAQRSRMRTARRLLAATDLPIKRIAAECGFSSAAGFCHAFRDRVGMTPLAYRNQEARAGRA